MIVRSFVATRRGLLGDADADARSVLDLAEPVPSQLAPALVAALVDAATGAGSLDKAAALLRYHDMDGDVPDAYTSAFLLGARGRLRLAEGRHEAAVEDFLECGRRQERIGMLNPAVVAWQSGAAVGLAAAGDPAAGRELAVEGLALARAFGAPRTVGIALRALAATVGGDDGVELLREAVATLAASPALLDQAAALIDLGMALPRRQRRFEAREPLRQGLDQATRCGAEGEARLAEYELRVGRGQAPPDPSVWVVVADAERTTGRSDGRLRSYQPADCPAALCLVAHGGKSPERCVPQARGPSPGVIYRPLWRCPSRRRRRFDPLGEAA